jgi:hypothetical protein
MVVGASSMEMSSSWSWGAMVVVLAICVISCSLCVVGNVGDLVADNRCTKSLYRVSAVAAMEDATRARFTSASGLKD